ncbi:ATP-binding protein [Caldimonas aquatica]|uniref:histidine kinase n=1 Tax=Caldimonas aquatica TaxID=376175 RepID=A0ABY6MTP1_9BURK|nr:ATP-binding protein [Schlegelella aquatica]UZD55349.1 ATP-binding protein [Schlegelella aquatica]
MKLRRCPSPASLSIRTRLLLLVLVVWLPAAIAFGVLARDTYLRESAALRARIEAVARSISSVLEREFDKRALLGATLAASRELRERDLARFYEEAAAAVQGTRDWVLVVDANRQLVNTLRPFQPGQTVPRSPGFALVSEPTLYFNPRGPVAGRPVMAVFVPEYGVAEQQLNVAVSFEPSVVQDIVERQADMRNTVIAVLLRDRVIARNIDPAQWVGSLATPDLRERLHTGATGFGSSRTLEGIETLAYLTPPDRYGVSVVIGAPQSELSAAAWRLTAQALAAAGTLLLIGLLVALYASRRSIRAVTALHEAARCLGRDEVPPPLRTGVAEVDAVSLALHQAGLQAHDAQRLLQEKIAEAVEQTRQAQARLLEAQKHEAIGRLSGGLAHDFNNILQTITTGLHLLKRTCTQESQHKVLDAASRAASRGAEVVRQMLSFGRAQPLDPRPVSLADFVLKNQELLAKAVGGQIALTADFAPDLPAVRADPTQLELALLNLVFNARDALPQGGRIVVRARPATDEETAGLPAGRYVSVEVVDDGVGMSAETVARAFEPYYTTKAVGAGSGLGLAQVMAFCRQSGGDARLRSQPGVGTAAQMLLPAAQGAAAAAEERPAARSAGRPLRVLMVEDDMLIASVVRPSLEAAGHRVVMCANADEARAQLARGERFDVLFTDMVMPGTMSGADLVQWCARHLPGLPAVVATGYSMQAPEGQRHLLRKPYAVEELLEALQQAVFEVCEP